MKQERDEVKQRGENKTLHCRTPTTCQRQEQAANEQLSPLAADQAAVTCQAIIEFRGIDKRASLESTGLLPKTRKVSHKGPLGK